MGKKSKVNKQQETNAAVANAQQNQIFQQQMLPSPEQKRFTSKSEAWDTWLKGKDYSKGPEGEFLNFDLWNPAQAQKQSARMAQLEGVGGAALGGGTGGGGDSSIALAMSRDRNANEAAQMAGAGYENAIGARNAYYEGNALPYAAFEANKMQGLLQNATQRQQFSTNAQIQTAPKPLLPMILGGALQAGASLLGNPGLFAGKALGG